MSDEQIESLKSMLEETLSRLLLICSDDELTPIGFTLILNTDNTEASDDALALGSGDHVFGETIGFWSREDITSAIRVLKRDREMMDIVRINVGDITE